MSKDHMSPASRLAEREQSPTKGSRAPSGAHPGSGRGKHRRDLRSRRGIRSGSHPLLRQTLRTAAPAVRGTRDLKDSSLQE